ncbi:MAG: peroxidase family protein [Pyrinomonadaceae bacterium]
MQRIAHGSNSIQLDEAPLLAVEEGNNNPALAIHTAAVATAVASTAVAPAASAVPHFTYLFEDLVEKPDKLLPDMAEAPSILEDLKELGMSMRDVEQKADGNSNIPSAYTYFGQFVDHDITFTDVKKPEGFTDAKVLGTDTQLSPLSLDEIHKIKNKRASILELDCVYGIIPSEKEEERKPPPRKTLPDNPAMMALGLVSESGDRPPGKTRDDYDLCRNKKSASDNGKFDRAAFIPDPRNDSNLIVSQLHVAFLRAHNELVRRGNSFDQARLILRDCYHRIIIQDFLIRIADPDVVRQVLSSSKPLYNPPKEGAFSLPLEFTVAAYRFGHSMIRKRYYVNDSARSLSLGKLFMLIVLGQGFEPKPGKGADTLPENMIVQWEAFLTGGQNMARQLNTRMVEPLFNLLDELDRPVDGEKSLAVQDLKRGYMLRIPTGQAIAERLEIANPLTTAQIEDLARKVSDAQYTALTKKETKLSSRTPLWFYILAEAKILGKEDRLGPVGSRLVAEVFIGLICRIPDSYLNVGWQHGELGSKKGEFNLTDLLRLANVLPKNN